MTDPTADLDAPEILNIINLLERNGGAIRKSGEHWLYKPAGTALPSTPVRPETVAALLAGGKLVPSPSGGLQSLAQAQQRSAKLTGHRPVRPAEDAQLPTVNEAESPLAWLRARKARNGKPLIADEQFLAGERLRADYEKSRLERRTTSSWDVSHVASCSGGNHAADITDSMITARQNFQAALAAVGPELSGMLVQVCCLSAGIEQAERLLDMPQRAGKAVLGLALTSLARHYGYLKPAAPRARGLGHWAIDGFRPEIAPYDGK